MERLRVTPIFESPKTPVPSELRVLKRPSLSPRAQETLQLMFTKNSYKKIAKAMFISRSTVHSYVTNIFNYFGVNDRISAVIAAVSSNYLQPKTFVTDAQLQKVKDLSPREIEVLEALVKNDVSGKSNKQIGSSLRISGNTIRIHFGNIYKKLDASRMQSALIFMEAKRKNLVTYKPKEHVVNINHEEFLKHYLQGYSESELSQQFDENLLVIRRYRRRILTFFDATDQTELIVRIGKREATKLRESAEQILKKSNISDNLGTLISNLTEKEVEVLETITAGNGKSSYKNAAEECRVSIKAIGKRLGKIYDKLGIHGKPKVALLYLAYKSAAAKNLNSKTNLPAA